MQRLTDLRVNDTVLLLVLMLVLVSLSLPLRPTLASDLEETRRAIDMMLVIDNSCSMFPCPQPDCLACGNDPDFFRIYGADLFIARLGFAETNETDYQVGVVSMGARPPDLIRPLQPVHEIRDLLAGEIADPEIQGQTQIIAALQAAYDELRDSPNRKPANLPAIVLITDGQPYPRTGQSDAEIEQLVAENPDISLFVMLLQTPQNTDAGYREYIAFWQGVQTRYTHVFAHKIESRQQIQETYNQIVAQLQDTIPSTGFPVMPGQPVRVFVSRYVQEIVLTIMHESGEMAGEVKVLDPLGNQVLDTDPGVNHRPPAENPTEVIHIGASRLERDDNGDGISDLKEADWIIDAEKEVMVFLDVRGAYEIMFREPTVTQGEVPHRYQAIGRHSPNRDLLIEFQLIDKAGNVIMDPQPIRGTVMHPDGAEALLPIPVDTQPDESGSYRLRYDYVSTNPAAREESGVYSLFLEAGVATDSFGEIVPITRARLDVSVQLGPLISGVSPETIDCRAGSQVELEVSIENAEYALPGSMRVRVFGGGKEVPLRDEGGGIFTGEVTPLCAALNASLACSTQAGDLFRVRLDAQSTDGLAMSPDEREVMVQVMAPPCTPTVTPSPTHTPTNTPTPAPTPTSTPIPDSDGDGVNDLEDRCSDLPGVRISWLGLANGCPIWALIVGGLLVLLLLAGLLVLLIRWLIPSVTILISPPPNGYVLVCDQEENTRWVMPTAVHTLGKSLRRNKITIGSKGHIKNQKLEDVEFRIEKGIDKGETVIVNAGTGQKIRAFKDIPETIRTSDARVKIIIGLDRGKMGC